VSVRRVLTHDICPYEIALCVFTRAPVIGGPIWSCSFGMDVGEWGKSKFSYEQIGVAFFSDDGIQVEGFQQSPVWGSRDTELCGDVNGDLIPRVTILAGFPDRTESVCLPLRVRYASWIAVGWRLTINEDKAEAVAPLSIFDGCF